jgi:hypothetical protein
MQDEIDQFIADFRRDLDAHSSQLSPPDLISPQRQAKKLVRMLQSLEDAGHSAVSEAREIAESAANRITQLRSAEPPLARHIDKARAIVALEGIVSDRQRKATQELLVEAVAIAPSAQKGRAGPLTTPLEVECLDCKRVIAGNRGGGTTRPGRIKRAIQTHSAKTHDGSEESDLAGLKRLAIALLGGSTDERFGRFHIRPAP